MFYPKFIYWAIPEKKNKQGRLRLYFFENPPWNFLSFYLTPEISRQKAQPLDISQNCVKSLGNSTLFFLGHPRKFHFVFNWPLEIPHTLSLIPLEIPYLHPRCRIFHDRTSIIKYQEKPMLIIGTGTEIWKVVQK